MTGGDWNKPLISDNYVSVLNEIAHKSEDAMTWLQTVSGVSNLPNTAKRFVSNRFEVWDGASWSILASTYAINVASAVTAINADNAADSAKLGGDNASLFSKLASTETFTGQKTFNLDAKMIAGKGVDFSANTNASGMTSEALTWYEEGTWTPTIEDGLANAPTYTGQNGRYVRIGSLVFIQGVITLATKGSMISTLGLKLAGFPFTNISGSGTNFPLVISYATNLNIVAGSSLAGSVLTGSKKADLYLHDTSSGNSSLLVSEIGATTTLNFSATYIT